MPQQLRLPFADIVVLKPNIAELVVFSGIELTSGMVQEYQQVLVKHLKQPIGLLINKRNAYTYSFSAQMEIGLAKEIRATAILVERESSVLVMQSIKGMPDHTQWNMDIFFERDAALTWLEQQLQT